MQCRHRLIRGAVGQFDLLRSEADFRLLPGFRAKTAEGVEPIGQGLGGKDQGRHPGRDLLQEEPLLPVQIGGAHKQDLRSRMGLAVGNGHAPRGLPVPQFDLVEGFEVLCLDLGQDSPPRGVAKSVGSIAAARDVGKAQILRGQLAAEGIEHFGQREPGGEIPVGGQRGREPP